MNIFVSHSTAFYRAFFAVLVLSFPAHVYAKSLNTASGVTHQVIPESLGHFKPVGKARLKVLWFKVYDAALFTESGLYSEAAPAALSLAYLRDIQASQLLSETEKQLNEKLSPQVIAQGVEQLTGIWPDIKKGDVLVYHLQTKDLGVFYHNGELIGELRLGDFAKAFMDIWLGADSAYPKLAAQLTGRAVKNVE